MKKIMIAVPCMDMVSARFAQSLATLNKVDYCVIAFQLSSLIYDSRNQLAAKAIEFECDYIMWFDSDMVFAPDTLQKLIADDKDIITGLYFRRSAPFTPVIFERLDIEDGEVKFKNYDDYPKDELFEIAGCGFGCVLMKTDVLFDIPDGQWFTPSIGLGEDCAFCIRAREKGYKIWCDPSVKLAHMGYVPVTESTYFGLKGEQSNNV